MRTFVFSVLAVAAFVVVSAASVRAEFVVYDDFNTGSVPNTNLWMPLSGLTPSVSDGSLVVDAPAMGGAGGVRSTTTFGYGSYRFVLSAFTGGSVIFGMNSYSTPGVMFAIDALYLRDDGGGAIYKNQVSEAAVPAGWPPLALPQTYTMIYHPDRMEIYRGADLLFRETDVNKIPQDAAMRFEVFAYNSGKLGVDAVSFQPIAVPEPSTLVLGAVGLFGLLCAAWKRRENGTCR
jgi:hypothetical protein